MSETRPIDFPFFALPDADPADAAATAHPPVVAARGAALDLDRVGRRFPLDGREVEAEAGQTIWEVAHGRGLVIPHLCHKPAPGYRPDGNCRACMVEVEGERTLVASCIREVAEGMVVHSASERAEKARATRDVRKNAWFFPRK